MTQYNLNIVLAVTSTDLTTGEKYVLSLEESGVVLPTAECGDGNIENLLVNLKKQYINLHELWIKHQLKTAIIQDSNLLLVYTAIIPYQTMLYNASWVSVFQCSDNKLVQNILRDILC
jgi:hypothetical protein